MIITDKRLIDFTVYKYMVQNLLKVKQRTLIPSDKILELLDVQEVE